MLLDKLRMALHHFGGSLTDDGQAHRDCLLRAPIGEEFFPGHSADKAAAIQSRFLDVFEAVGKPVRSYWTSLRKNPVPQSGWEIARRPHIHGNSEDVFQLHLQAAQVEKRGTR